MSADRFRLAIALLAGVLLVDHLARRPQPAAVQASTTTDRYQLIQLVEDDAIMTASTRIFEPGTGKLYVWLPADEKRNKPPSLVVLDPIRATRSTRPIKVSSSP